MAHPLIVKDPARARFVGFGDSSLNVEIVAYVATRDFGEFLAVQEDVLLRVMNLVEASGTGFAFPSQTLYLSRDSGLDAERKRAAEAEVGEWRERGGPRFRTWTRSTPGPWRTHWTCPPPAGSRRAESAKAPGLASVERGSSVETNNL